MLYAGLYVWYQNLKGRCQLTAFTYSFKLDIIKMTYSSLKYYFSLKGLSLNRAKLTKQRDKVLASEFIIRILEESPGRPIIFTK